MAGFQYNKPECKLDGCNKPPAARVGPYAGLCEGHSDDAKQRRRERMKQKRNANGNEKIGANEVSQHLTNEIKLIKNSKKQLTRAAIRLASHAEIFEVAVEHRDEKIDDAKRALAKLDESLEEFKRIVKAKLTGGPAASE